MLYKRSYGHPAFNRETCQAAHSDGVQLNRVARALISQMGSQLTWGLLGTHQGAVPSGHLDAYLDEYTFRFYRRR